MNCLNIGNVIQQLDTPVFKQDLDLLSSAYEFVRKNWDQVVRRKDFIKIIENLSTDGNAARFWKDVLRKLPPKRV